MKPRTPPKKHQSVAAKVLSKQAKKLTQEDKSSKYAKVPKPNEPSLTVHTFTGPVPRAKAEAMKWRGFSNAYISVALGDGDAHLIGRASTVGFGKLTKDPKEMRKAIDLKVRELLRTMIMAKELKGGDEDTTLSAIKRQANRYR